MIPIGNFCHVLVNLIYPQHCFVCDCKIDELKPSPICAACGDKIKGNSKRTQFFTNDDDFAFDKAFYATDYEDVAKRCICLFKYEGRARLAQPLGMLMSDFAVENIDAGSVDLVVPVPLHPVKLRERGFNQSELLAERIARRLNKKIERNRIIRTKYTLPQTRLNKQERLKNVRGAFSVKDNKDFKGASVLLVDDVFTTGATLHECAKALKKAGAKSVTAFTLARGI